ncbi:MAG: hypothetical protein OXP66_13925 [Candidatus Tectomicrobia bacterium]|nr:hypothetical protein [Candidatus Tectomicrobia bacterium]
MRQTGSEGISTALVVKVFLGVLAAVVLLGVTGYGLGWFQEAAEVTREEFGPRAVLQKYEWFKDASAQLDKKRVDIRVYEARLEALQAAYDGVERNDWDRVDKQQGNLWLAELTGVISSYNSLAAEYNAEMSKFNWRFANVGELPRGASQPLPREYRPYEEK